MRGHRGNADWKYNGHICLHIEISLKACQSLVFIHHKSADAHRRVWTDMCVDLAPCVLPGTKMLENSKPVVPLWTSRQGTPCSWFSHRTLMLLLAMVSDQRRCRGATLQSRPPALQLLRAHRFVCVSTVPHASLARFGSTSFSVGRKYDPYSGVVQFVCFQRRV